MQEEDVEAPATHTRTPVFPCTMVRGDEHTWEMLMSHWCWVGTTALSAPDEAGVKEQAWPLAAYIADAELNFNQQPWQKPWLEEGRKGEEKETILVYLDPLLPPPKAHTLCALYAKTIADALALQLSSEAKETTVILMIQLMIIHIK